MRFNKRSRCKVYKSIIWMRTLVKSHKNIIKKDVTNLVTPFPLKNIALKMFSYANKDSRELIVAAYDSVAGEPSETV